MQLVPHGKDAGGVLEAESLAGFFIEVSSFKNFVLSWLVTPEGLHYHQSALFRSLH